MGVCEECVGAAAEGKRECGGCGEIAVVAEWEEMRWVMSGGAQVNCARI